MQNGVIRLLALGDIVGISAVQVLSSRLRRYRSDAGIDLVIANGENAAVGNGLDPMTAKQILSAGVDVITSGNHIFHKKEIAEWLDSGRPVIRPANYPSDAPGDGYFIVDVYGYKALVINVLGVSFMSPTLENPFHCVERLLGRMQGCYDFAVLDVHAEATSEKYALGRYFDGRISVVCGTHTHVQTADETVFPGGTGYITDLGMCGPDDSILGIRTDKVIEKMRTAMPVRFEIAEGHVTAHGAIFDIETEHFRTVRAERVAF